MANRTYDLEGLWVALIFVVVFGCIYLMDKSDAAERAIARREKCHADLYRVSPADSLRIIRNRPECAP